MRKNIFIIVGIGIFALALSGCATTNNGDSGASMSNGPVGMSGALKFDDVPVPAGFRLINNESFSF